MKSIFDRLIYPTAAAVLSALFVAWFLNSGKEPSLKATIDWIELPRKIVPDIDYKKRETVAEALRTIEGAYGVLQLDDIFEKFGYRSNLALAKLRIENSEEVRSKAVEVDIPDAVAVVIARNNVMTLEHSSHIAIGVLDPGTGLDIYIVGDAGANISEEIRVLQNDRRIEINDLKYVEGYRSFWDN